MEEPGEVLVIDIGGTKINVSLVTSLDLKIKILGSEIFSTHSKPDMAIQKIKSVYLGFNEVVDCVLLSLSGKWSNKGILEEGINLQNWSGYPFIENLKKELNIKNYASETDVICGGLGEYHCGVNVGTLHTTSLLYINLGTGIGASFIKDGKPFKSLRMHKLCFSSDDELYSGVDLISGKGLLIASAYESVEKLFEDYKKGNINAVDIISKAQAQLATWLINLFYLFMPDVIVLNGGLTYDWDVLASEAIDMAKEELKDQVKILPSKLKDLAPDYGAYLNSKGTVAKHPTNYKVARS